MESLKRGKLMKKIFYILCLLVLWCNPGISQVSNERDNALGLLIKEKLPNNQYAKILQYSKKYRFDKQGSLYFKNHDIYKCIIFDVDFPNRDFKVAISKDNNEVYILTENVEELNKIYRSENIKINDEKTATSFADEVLYITQPYEIKFIKVEYVEVLKRWLPDGHVKKYKKDIHSLLMKKNKDAGFYGDLIILLGVDLIKRTIKIDSAGIHFSDTIIAKDALPH